MIPTWHQKQLLPKKSLINKSNVIEARYTFTVGGLVIIQHIFVYLSYTLFISVSSTFKSIYSAVKTPKFIDKVIVEFVEGRLFDESEGYWAGVVNFTML